MPRAYSLDLRQRLIDAVEAGSSARAAARRLDVSASTAVKWVQRKRETGSVEAKPMHGHPPAKLVSHKDRLLRLVVEKSDLTLNRSASAWLPTAFMSARAVFIPSFGGNRIRLKKDRARGGTEPTGRQKVA